MLNDTYILISHVQNSQKLCDYCIFLHLKLKTNFPSKEILLLRDERCSAACRMRLFIRLIGKQFDIAEYVAPPAGIYTQPHYFKVLILH